MCCLIACVLFLMVMAKVAMMLSLSFSSISDCISILINWDRMTKHFFYSFLLRGIVLTLSNFYRKTSSKPQEGSLIYNKQT
ncbi:hypothetical protein CDL12_00579 [Handroanthus impetiginosus]|uniref:Secreted protein n=1 Tax=Handroanthus impetiginosus TaxID=429701 RepID=A0A2G9IA81_9LAMI|nr:hypothetical protein CDL12_00579 [Handroanthus impetiginosus]